MAEPKPGKHYRSIMGRLGRGKTLTEVGAEMLAAIDDSERDALLADLAYAGRKTR